MDLEISNKIMECYFENLYMWKTIDETGMLIVFVFEFSSFSSMHSNLFFDVLDNILWIRHIYYALYMIAWFPSHFM